ncbi:hypothetical protein D3C72_2390860 [compost metagenome]
MLPGDVELGVLADGAKRRGGAADPLADIAQGGTDKIARHQHQADFMVIAKQRSQALVINQRNSAQHHNTGDTGE